MDKLTEIMAHKRRELAPHLRPVTNAELLLAGADGPKPASFAAALKRSDGRLAVIAEIKRRSPSAGEIKSHVSASGQARRYLAAGADALSVLTDLQFFGGTLDDLRAVTGGFRTTWPFPGVDPVNPLPCLRKDFLFHPLQVLEACAAGASAILVIIRALSDDEIVALLAAASTAGLDALCEIHDEADLERALHHGARIIGVNNRDLTTFQTDLAVSERLIPRLPRGAIGVSESGINTADDAARVRAAGARAVLVGEALMRAADPGALITAIRAAG